MFDFDDLEDAEDCCIHASTLAFLLLITRSIVSAVQLGCGAGAGGLLEDYSKHYDYDCDDDYYYCCCC